MEVLVLHGIDRNSNNVQYVLHTKLSWNSYLEYSGILFQQNLQNIGCSDAMDEEEDVLLYRMLENKIRQERLRKGSFQVN